MTVINHTCKFVFVHVPKSGGTSVTRALEPLCNWKDLQLGGSEFGELIHKAYCNTYGLAKHSFAGELRSSMGPLEWTQYTSFVVVRHPIERTISTYRYLRHHRDHYTFMNEFDDFGAFIESEFWQGNGPDRMFLPQWRWVRPQLDKPLFCDRWLKLEELDTKLKPLLHQIGVPKAKLPKIKLKTFNASPKNIPVEMSAGHRAMIVERYSHDFKMFHYDPDTDEQAPPSA